MDLAAVLRGYWLDRTDELSMNTVEQYKYSFRMFVQFIGEDTDLSKSPNGI